MFYVVQKNVFETYNILIKMSNIPKLNPIITFFDKRTTKPEIVLNDQYLTSFYEHWF